MPKLLPKHVAVPLLVAMPWLVPCVAEAQPVREASSLVARPADFAHERLTLPNGLVVLLHEDHRAPVVGIALLFRTAYASDPEGMRGFTPLFAHLFEHGSTRHVPLASRARFFETMGTAKWSTTTGFNEDHVAHTGTVSASALDLALWLEADRLGFGVDGIDDEAVRAAHANLPQSGHEGVFLEEERAFWGKGHPYAEYYGPLEIDKASTVAIREAFARRCDPKNVVLALSGSFSTAHAKETIQKYFGPLVSRDGAATRSPEKPSSFPATSSFRMEGRGPRTIRIDWRTVPYFQDGDALLDELSEILTTRLTARVPEWNPRVHQSSSRLGSRFWIALSPGPKPAATDVVALVDRVLAELRDNGPTEAELLAAQRIRMTSLFRHLEEAGTRASFLAQAEEITGGKGRLFSYQRETLSSTRDRMKELVKTSLPLEHRFIFEAVHNPAAPTEGRVLQGGVQ